MPVSARTCFLCGTSHFTTQRCPAKKVAPTLPAGVTKGVPVVAKAAVSDLVAATPAQPAEKAGKKPRQKITENITEPSPEDWKARALAAEAALEARRAADRARTDRRRKKVAT